MASSADLLLQSAKKAHRDGTPTEARATYGLLADFAREHGDTDLLAYALRHGSDLNHVLGEAGAALAQAQEAIAIYQRLEPRQEIALANAFRLSAVAYHDLGQTESALAAWREARELYRRTGVQAGVDEAERKMARTA
jgi:hypothetical protein